MAIAPSIRRFALPALKLAILLVVIWGAHRTISGSFDDLRKNGWHVSQLNVPFAILAGLLYLFSQLPCGLYWHGVLSALGQSVPLSRTLRAYYLGHLGKYVPGKAMVVVLRAGLIAQPQLNTSLAVASIFYETFATMAVGAILALAILLIAQVHQLWLIAFSLVLALLLGLPTFPSIFRRLLRWLPGAPSTSSAAPTDQNEFHLSKGVVFAGCISIAAGWLLTGLSLWATLRAIGFEDPNLADLPIYTATVALSVASGFVSMLPAGIGVREIVLMQLLAPQLEIAAPSQGQRLALVAVIALRLIWLASELLLAAVIYPLGRRANQNAAK
jgi:glycosyltransferase 2 family protein